MESKKPTMKEKYAEIIKFIEDNGGGNHMIEFLQDRVNKLDKKTNSAAAKKDENTEECMDILADILDYTRIMRATDVLNAAKGLDADLIEVLKNGRDDLTVQRITSLLGKMVAAERAEKVIEKKGTYFKLR